MIAEAYRELQEALGRDNVSDDPVTCTSYAWNAGLGGIPKANRLSDVPPVCIAMPGSAEEVQALVHVCLRHGMRFKSHSTGWGSFATVGSPNAISVDLRRMNRIHSIDARNQMAVIDPYVTAGQLQAEAMKVGLNCHIVGAGLTHSPLASAAAMIGVGITGTTTGNNARNLLGLEWVTPAGEIVRIGTPSSGPDWYSDEGPGPGFRGMIRGLVGTLGELGVFTRIGFKLYPWPGPAVPERTGRHPNVGMKIPEHFRLHQLIWDDWKGATDAAYKINAAGIAYVLLRLPPNSFGTLLTATNNDFYAMVSGDGTPDIVKDTDEFRHSWTLLCGSASAAEAAYKAHVVSDILDSTGGREMPLDIQQAEMITNLLVTSINVPRILRPSSAMATSFGVLETFSHLPGTMAAGEKILREENRAGGNLMQGHGEEFWTWPNERRQMWAENAFSYDVNQAASRGAVIRTVLDQGNLIETQGNLGFDTFGAIGPLADFFSPASNGATRWMRRIKLRFDKKGVNDGMLYVARDEPWVARHWPLMRKALFFRPLRPVYKRVTHFLAVAGLGVILAKRRK